MEQRIVSITSGPIRGFREGGISKFLGVPYAASPTGPRRFRLPEPHAPWTDVRDATQPGPNAPQVVRDLGPLDPVPLVGPGWARGDDFLSVNVWTPDEKAQGLPVMVFVHGGSFAVGSKDAPINDGTELARAGVVSIAINYRMGVEGFLPIPRAPANLGLHDQLEAFRWVKANARAFGGDPDNVTIHGESAGAMTVANLVASPLAQGLFRRAIVQSGHCAMVRKPAVAARMVKAVARLLGVKPDVEGFRQASLEASVDALEKTMQPGFKVDLRDPQTGLEPTFGLSKYAPVTGDTVLPEAPIAMLRKGVGKDVDLLIGANAEEMNIYFVPLDVPRKVGGVLAWILLGKSIRRPWEILKAYGMGRRIGGKKKTGGQAMTEAMTDLVFRAPTRTMALAHQGRTHVYEFDYRSEAWNGQLGACHALDVPFVFKTLDACKGPRGIAGDNPPLDFADRVQKIWVDFARDGSFPAGEYTADDRQVYHLHAGRVVADPPMPATAFLPRE